MIPWLETNDPFPDISQALNGESEYPGLLAASEGMTVNRLIDAYRHGIFPWYGEGQPVLWWSTDPRMVLMTDRFTVSHSLKKKLRQVHKSMHANGPWQLRFDSAFSKVIRECAAPRKHASGTWITDEIISNYEKLHELGHAHSSELWLDGELVGGAYGICMGKMFFGESMFARKTDASKIALAHLVFFLRANGVSMIDCQQETAHLASLGASPISRDDFRIHLEHTVDMASIGSWREPHDCPLCQFSV